MTVRARHRVPVQSRVAAATGGMTGSDAATTGTSGTTGAPSSTNPQAGGGDAGYQAPREVPEAGGPPNATVPNPR